MFYRTSPVTASQSLGFHSATLLKKRLRQRCFSVNFAKCLRISFLLTEHLRMTASCVYLRILRNFLEVFYKRTLFLQNTFEKLLFHVQVAEFQPLGIVKNYSTGAFQASYTRLRSSDSKVFIYIKSLKTVCEEVNLKWSCEMPTCSFTKWSLSGILFHVFCLHFLRMHQDLETVLQRCTVIKTVLRNFAKMQVWDLWLATLLKKRLLKSLRTAFLTEYLWWLLLKISSCEEALKVCEYNLS